MEALVATKVTVEARGHRLVVRPRLRQILDEAGRARLVLLSAPAGFGKTTLVTDWLAASRARHAWLSLDEADNDPARFLRYLHASGQALDGGAEPRGHTKGRPPDRDLVLAGLVDRIRAGPRRACIVLDDFHLIRATAVHAIVTELLDRLPRNGQLVIATRSDPPLPLARLRARGELVEIRADALRFDAVESEAFLDEALGLDLVPPDVAHLAERTEGWAAALQLAGLSLRGRSDRSRLVREFGASNRFVLDYVVDEVLASLPETTQQFLLATSVLGRLCGPLCDAVTGAHDSQDRLEAIERANLLLFPLDQERGWYRYHQLFADLLQARLARRDPELPAALHGRASAWFEGNGQIDRAVDHALRAGDIARSVALVRGAWLSIMHGGELWTVQGWLDRLPPATLRDDPQLCATYAWGLVLRGETDGVEDRLLDAERALDPAAAVEPVDRALVPSQLHSIRAKVAELRGNPAAAIDHAEAALAAIPPDIDPLFGALLRGDATSLIGQACLLAGDDRGAAAAFRSSVPLLRRGGNHIGVSHAIHNLARIEVRVGRPSPALELCDAELARHGPTDDDLPAYAAVYIGRAEALLALGDRPAATAAAVRAGELARVNGDGPATRGADALLARIVADRRPGSGRLPEQLTPRELEVLRLVALGRSNRSIAAELFVTLGTVKSHVHAIAGKLGALNRVEAVVRAREAGLLD
jgi:LuxR family maltose regulon positive regulatory protein